MWYKQIKKLPEVKLNSLKPSGRYEPNVQKAKRLGLRYRPWREIGEHWLANPGINRPYPSFWREGGKFYREIKELVEQDSKHNIQKIVELQNRAIEEVRYKIKEILEIDKSYKIIFDSNGSVLCSTIAKIFKNPQKISLTFSDQGRLVYSAIGLETKTISKFVSNFEQPIGLFEAPPPKKKINCKSPLSKNVNVINIFNLDNTYKSDAQIILEYERKIRDKKIDFVLLLHVSRTGRILPIEDLIAITKRYRPDLVVFVDGAQAIGRISYEKIKKIIELADCYLIVGHKALGGAISSASIIKENVSKIITNKIKQAPFYNLKLFQFEEPQQNLIILNRAFEENRPYWFVSAPELLTLVAALEDNKQKFWEYQKEICTYKERLLKFLGNKPGVYLNVNRVNCVDDIISFHLETPQQAIFLKEKLQSLNPPITIGPLTENYAIRIGIEPKLPNLKKTIQYFEESLAKILNFY
ncbi:MAG: aminotransferase class V-fold PLP-dependent enzyme [Candidatus Anstonellaceae archaeon]